ncbi:hypothetical protein FJR38_18035 [Anabaena sp. UHCC 0253]|uniref:hypothetical protein n=1 Tax=Anabaena sp. UHCC 0253 TaxID=2590019 RepID=UPI0014453033|nr:hypothetical protein [Anabaena sp. UHCC 0253]MTJ54419.1 hypothetical protein [Anabaena sp. UHCC 0253]
MNLTFKNAIAQADDKINDDEIENSDIITELSAGDKKLISVSKVFHAFWGDVKSQNFIESHNKI